ncbi:MAG: hypothetical protein EA402_11155 [Planctomycetota bacterium]|nr:MAG: hypothetical protein EA402_11155 [Planctomycetota bacterium]
MLPQQLRRPLTADATNAGNIISAIANHAEPIGHLLRRNTALLPEIGRRTPGITKGIPGAYLRAQ